MVISMQTLRTLILIFLYLRVVVIYNWIHGVDKYMKICLDKSSLILGRHDIGTLKI